MQEQDESLRQKIKRALQLGRTLHFVWESAKSWTLVNLALVLTQGALPLAALYLMKRILDAVTKNIALADKAQAFQHVVIWILLAGGVALLSALTRSLSEYASEAQSLQVTNAVSDLLHTQSIAVDLAYYEDPSYYDTLHRAQQEAPFRPTHIVNGLIQIAVSSISLLGILGLLCSFNWLLALILFLAAFPSVLVRLRYSRR